MGNTDTIHLLKECDAGTKMAISSIDEVIEKVEDSAMRSLLQESKNHHKALEKEISSQLSKYDAEGKEPNPIAKGMSWMKTNMKLGMDNSDKTVANLITDGCNMGVKSLNQYYNQYKCADSSAKDICKRLALIEEQLGKELQKFL